MRQKYKSQILVHQREWPLFWIHKGDFTILHHLHSTQAYGFTDPPGTEGQWRCADAWWRWCWGGWGWERPEPPGCQTLTTAAAPPSAAPPQPPPECTAVKEEEVMLYDVRSDLIIIYYWLIGYWFGYLFLFLFCHEHFIFLFSHSQIIEAPVNSSLHSLKNLLVSIHPLIHSFNHSQT